MRVESIFYGIEAMTTWIWTPKRMRAAEMLARGHMYNEVAAEVHVSERSLYRWMRVPAFEEQIKAFEAEARDKATRVLRKNAIAAANSLVLLMQAGGRYDQVRLKASTEILDRIGVVTVTKIAPTDPSGDNPYTGLNDDELRDAILQAARAVAGGEALPLDNDGEADPETASG